MEMRRKEFGLRIKTLRKERGISQKTFAMMIGINQAYLSGIENGRRNVSFDNIAKIADGLGLSLEELFRTM